MKDQGLQQAIDAAGGVAALARKLGIAQPSVSNWTRVPVDRVHAVEHATGVPRTTLRPDLFSEARAIDDVDLARSREYLLLGSLIRQAPTAALLKDIAGLKGDVSTLGMAHMQLAEAAALTDADMESREFFRLFVGVARGELLPYASYYLTGFLHERPLAAVRADLKTLGVEREPDMLEPEDNLGILFDVMAGLISGQFGDGEEASRSFHRKHIAPWAGRLFVDLESCAQTRFYKAVGRLGAAFMDVEIEGYALPA